MILRLVIYVLITFGFVYLAVFLGLTFPDKCNGEEPTNTEFPKRILIVQHQTLGTYRDIAFGYIKNLPEEKYLITQFNAEGDLVSLDKFLLKTANEKKYNLILALGTLAANKILYLEKNVPILVSGLSSPEYSGIMKHWEGTKTNYSGVEIKNQTYNGLKYVRKLLTFDSIGYLYIINEPSHEGTLLELQKLGNDVGFKVFAKGIYNRDANRQKYPDSYMSVVIKEAMEEIMPYTKTWFMNISKTWIDNYKVFNDEFIKHNILSIGDKSYMGLGLVIGITSDYFKRGELLAFYTSEILEKGVDIGSLKMDMIPQFQIEYDMIAAQKIRFNPDVRFLLNVLSIQTNLE